MSIRIPGPPGGWNELISPGDGTKVKGFSAVIRASMLQPWIRRSSCRNGSGSPAAIRICSFTRSIPVMFSVTGCSTWTRVFISMK